MTERELVRVRKLEKSYGATRVLQDINLTVKPGETVMLVGPSGAGKSTLLRCINRIEDPTSGEIFVNGADMVHSEQHPGCQPASAKELAIKRRAVGMVFQRFNLFPHLSAIDNVAIGPHRVLGVPLRQARQEAAQLLTRVKLAEHAAKTPRQLSGGQQQRVGIARALAMKPSLLLLDEPTSALDPELVGEVLEVIKELAYAGMTQLIVTHELAFARQVGSRIVFMETGRIRLDAEPSIFFSPHQEERIRTFIGKTQAH